MHADKRKASSPGDLTSVSIQPGLFLREVDKVLELYCTALAGRALKIKGLSQAPAESLREGHHLPISDGKSIYLPERLEGPAETAAEHPGKDYARAGNAKCATAGSALKADEPGDEAAVPATGLGCFDYYVVLGSHQAGYSEFGTFEFDIDKLLQDERFPADHLKDAGSRLPILSHYDLFFASFENLKLARDIFFAVEDGRVDHRLCSQYRGLARKIERASAHELAQRTPPSSLPPLEGLVESLVRLSLGEERAAPLPRHLTAVWESATIEYQQVLQPAATVIDSAVATARIYLLFLNFLREFLGAPAQVGARSPVELARGDEVQDYPGVQPVDFRGQTDPGRVQFDDALNILQELEENQAEAQGVPLTPQALEELLKKGIKIKILGMSADELMETAGLFVTDLKGILQEKMKDLTVDEKKKLGRLLKRMQSQTEEHSRVFYYDEWDFLIEEYRPHWCRLVETLMEMGTGAEVARIRRENRPLINAVKRSYQRIRPEMLRRVKRLRDGEDIELDHAIDAVIDKKAGLIPSFRIYQNRERRARDIATCFLLDLSASTDEWVVEEPKPTRAEPPPRPQVNPFSFFSPAAPLEDGRGIAPSPGAKRVIDIEREALIIVAEALENLGDEYAIYGFSGYGRENIEFLLIKEFSEPYADRIRRRIEGLEPRKSTRMGPAIRHSVEKLARTGKRMKILILLSDGYPQDFDYGPDRASREYGLRDTAAALQEARRRNIHTFCITVDQAGNDYLSDMCGGRDYFIVKRASSLPHVLPRIYRKLTV